MSPQLQDPVFWRGAVALEDAHPKTARKPPAKRAKGRQ